MNTKEIKIVYSSDNTASFYRMEGARWCLIADSDDSLRPYIQEKMGSDAWNKKFFAACRQAAFAAEEDRLVIWFEGSAEDYSDFRESLDDCALDEDIRVKRIKTEPQEPIPEENTDEGELETETEVIHEADIVSEAVEDESALVTDDSASDTIEDLDEEKVNEKTGILEYPGEGAWSWRRKYPEIPTDEKETIRVDTNTIVDQELVLVNKIVVLMANVSIIKKVQCIHCSILIDKDASVNILSNAALWLKHCVIEGYSLEKCWVAKKEQKHMVNVDGALHIYDSTIQSLEIVGLIEPEGYAIYNSGLCHIVDTKIQNCKGNYIFNYFVEKFCGSRISMDQFAGQFIDSNHCFSNEQCRLEYCSFHFSSHEEFKGMLNGTRICRRAPFMRFRGNIYFSEFIQIDDRHLWGSNVSIEIDNGYVQKSTFDIGGIIDVDGVTFEECKFAKCYQIQGNSSCDALQFIKCSFINGIAFGRSLISVTGYQPSYTTIIDSCKFYQCICERIFEFIFVCELKKYKNCTIQNNTFHDCITNDVIIYGEFKNNIKNIINSYVKNNYFYSCVCTDYVKSTATYGLFKKPCTPFYVEGRETVKALSAWSEAMKYAKCEADVLELEKTLKE